MFDAANVCVDSVEEYFEVLDLDEREQAAVYYLCDILGQSLKDALRNYDEVTLSEGSIDQVVDELFDELYRVDAAVRQYIDIDAFARDLERGGDVTEFLFGNTYWCCTNANSL